MLTRFGFSLRHGPHQAAQKSMIVTLPFTSSNDNILPLGSSDLKLGALLPMLIDSSRSFRATKEFIFCPMNLFAAFLLITFLSPIRFFLNFSVFWLVPINCVSKMSRETSKSVLLSINSCG